MRKERHLKTIQERFGINENLKDASAIRKLRKEIVSKIETYKKYNYKNR